MTAAPVAEQTSLFTTEDIPSGRTRKHRLLAAIEPSVPLPAVMHRSDLTPRAVSLLEATRLLAEVIKRSGALTVDVETTGYPLGHRHYQLRTVQLGDADTAVVFDATTYPRILRALLGHAPKLHAYSATADLVPLVHAGLIDYDEAWAKMHDTMLVTKLANPNAIGTDAGLKQTAAEILGADAITPNAEDGRKELFAAGGWLSDTELDTEPDRNGWLQVHPTMRRMVLYAAADVLDTAALPARLPHVAPGIIERERAVQRITARITHQGLPLAPSTVTELLGHHNQALVAARSNCVSQGLSDPASNPTVATSLAGLGAEIPSTDKGNPSVTSAVLTKLTREPGPLAELARAVLEYRNHATLLATFLVPYNLMCTNGDGRVRPTIYTLSARTGRMSSVRVNLQNVPREGGIRSCITADTGWLLCSADLAGIELRVAAALSGDPVLTEAVINGTSKDKTDIHWLVAQQVFGAQATKTHRYTVKPGVYGYLYGGGADRLKDEMGCDLSIAEAVIEGLKALTPQYVGWANRLKWGAKKGNNRYTLYTGVELQLPLDTPHKWPNYIIQRTSRDILCDALLRWKQTQWGDSVLLPIHDEVVVMVPEAAAIEATDTLLACMATEFDGIPIVAAANPPAFAWQDAA